MYIPLILKFVTLALATTEAADHVRLSKSFTIAHKFGSVSLKFVARKGSKKAEIYVKETTLASVIPNREQWFDLYTGPIQPRSWDSFEL